jgi:hypothetical protein
MMMIDVVERAIEEVIMTARVAGTTTTTTRDAEVVEGVITMVQVDETTMTMMRDVVVVEAIMTGQAAGTITTTIMTDVVEKATEVDAEVAKAVSLSSAPNDFKPNDHPPVGGGRGGGGENMSPELKAAVENAKQDRVELQNAAPEFKAQCAEACKNSEAEVIRLGGNPGKRVTRQFFAGVKAVLTLSPFRYDWRRRRRRSRWAWPSRRGWRQRRTRRRRTW